LTPNPTPNAPWLRPAGRKIGHGAGEDELATEQFAHADGSLVIHRAAQGEALLLEDRLELLALHHPDLAGVHQFVHNPVFDGGSQGPVPVLGGVVDS